MVGVTDMCQMLVNYCDHEDAAKNWLLINYIRKKKGLDLVPLYQAVFSCSIV